MNGHKTIVYLVQSSFKQAGDRAYSGLAELTSDPPDPSMQIPLRHGGLKSEKDAFALLH